MSKDCTIQDVFHRFYSSFESTHDISPAQRKAAYHIMNCKKYISKLKDMDAPAIIRLLYNKDICNKKSQYCFFVCTTFDSFLNDL
uniref:hypothetical protein n=1 Tax=Blautia faecicola TaxID=2509240 RepID=UPI001FA99307|nr:hypothetical protein [Blautia faecicola]